MSTAPKEGPAATVAAATEVNRDEVLRASYAEATKQLREKHRDEFNQLRKELAAEAGVDWTPEPTEEEKAAKIIADLLVQHPDLVTQFQAANPPGV